MRDLKDRDGFHGRNGLHELDRKEGRGGFLFCFESGGGNDFFFLFLRDERKNGV